MSAFLGLARRFARAERGLAAVEFAMVVPFLLIMLLATFDAGRVIAAYMKLRAATFALASITNQYTTSTNGITTAGMSGITGSSTAIMYPFPGTTVGRITQIKATSLTAATVSWSSATDTSAYPQGMTWPTASMPSMLAAGNNACNSFPCYLIFAEMTYTYTPVFGYFLTGSIVLRDNVWVTPRSSVCIQYFNPTATPATC